MHETRRAVGLMAIAYATLSSTAAAQTARYWAGPPTGAWSDPANWSTFPAGAPLGGLPQAGDTPTIIGPYTIHYTGPGLPDPAFAAVLLSGVPGDPLAFFHDADTLTVDPASDTGLLLKDATYTNTGGHLYTPRLDTLNAATIHLTTTAGSLTTAELNAPADTGLDQTVDITIDGGSFSADTLTLGRAGGATLRQTAGYAAFQTLTIGAHDPVADNHAPAVVTLTGGSTSVQHTLSVGGDANGNGELVIDGGHVTAHELRLLDGPRAAATLTLRNGTLSSYETRLNTAGRSPDYAARFDQTGGEFSASQLHIGDNETAAPVIYHITAGSANISSITRLANPDNSDATLIVDNADYHTGQLYLARGNNAHATIAVTNGATFDTLYVSAVDAGYAEWTVSDATVTARRITCYSPQIDFRLEYNATLSVDEFNLDGSLFLDNATINTDELNLAGDATLYEGEINANNVTVDGSVSFLFTATLRTPTLTNRGRIDLRTVSNQPLITGPFANPEDPAPTAGVLINEGRVTVHRTLDLPCTVRMHVTNQATVDLAADARLVIDGSLTATDTSAIAADLDPDATRLITVASGDAHLDGALVLTGPAALNTAGATIDIVSCPNGLLTGAFASVEFVGFTGELVYTPTAVSVRTPCNVADLAAPYAALNNTDINAFVSAFIAQSPAADLNADGGFNNTDINIFVGNFLAACD